MKTYEVLIPITGYICIELEAEDEVQAKEFAMEKANNCPTDSIEEWCIHEQICRGNVLEAMLNVISVEEV